MKRPLTLRIGIALALLGVAGGCESLRQSPPPAPVAATGFPFEVTDDSGRRVTIPASPQRIVSLSPAHTETLYALGAGDKLIATDTYSDYPTEVRSKATLKCWPRVPLEQVVALKPDLVLVLTEHGEELKRMEAAGIRVVQFFPKTFADTLTRIKLIGRITGKEVAAGEIVASMEERVAVVQRRVESKPRVRVLYELDATDAARPWVAGGGAIYNEVIRLAGGENVFAAQKQPTLQVGAEQVIVADPEVILLGDTASPLQPQTPALVRNRTGWSQLAAVKSGRVFGVQSERISRPAPRFVEGVEEVAQRIADPGTRK